MATPAATRTIPTRLLGFSFESGERRPTLWLAAYLLLAIASVIGLKAAANSLFLKEFSARQLPLVYVAVAVVMASLMPLYLRLSARLAQNRLAIYTQVFFATDLVLFWWLLRLELSGMPALLYVWVEAFSVILPTQVWTLANHLFTTRQARRLFSVVGSGGILGAALGGLAGRELTLRIGTQNLLLVYVFFLLACSAIVSYLWRTERPAVARSTQKQPAPATLTESLEAIRGSRYLSLMTLLVALSAVVNILVDYQFRYIVAREISDQDGMTALFASFSSYLAVFSFFMHLVLTSRIMRLFGLNFAIFVLPVSMLIGSGVLLASTGLLAGILLKGFDGAFRHSIDRSSTELLYVPLPSRLKQQAKSFIDMVAGRWAVGLGGVLLFLLAYMWRFSVQQISWVSVALIVPWLAVAWMLRREYVQTLRTSIERRDTSAEALLMELAGASGSEELTATLVSSDERAVETGLGWLQYGASGAQSHLGELLTHIAPAIRRKAMAVVSAKNAAGCAAQVARFLYLDDQVEPLWLALEYLERHDPQQSQVKLADLLESDHAVLRGTVAARLLAGGDAAVRARAYEVFSAFIASAGGPGTAYRQRAAELLGRVPSELGCQQALGEWLEDRDPDVVRAAIVSAGRVRRSDLVPRLVALAGDRRWRTEAREALAEFGVEILALLQRQLLDPAIPLRIRRHLPRVFSTVGGQQAADYLAACLDQADSRLEYPLMRALSRIRLKDPSISFDTTRITNLAMAELRRHYRYLSIRQGVSSDGSSPGIRFLARALSEQLDRRLENIFRLIGLLYPAKDIFDAYYGIRSGRRDLRANAVEFLDSVLLNPLRQMLLPILEDRSPERILEYARAQWGIRKSSYTEALRELLAEPDPWLQACAVYVAADQGLKELEPLVERLAQASDELLQETARAARQRLLAAPVSSPGATWRT